MKTTKYALAAALVLIAVSVPAHADTITNYTINFTTTLGGPAPASGSFTYDSTNPLFSNFIVTWNGIAFDMTAAANAPVLAGQGAPGQGVCVSQFPGPAFGFLIMSMGLNGAACIPQYNWEAGPATQGMTGFEFIASSPAASYGPCIISTTGNCFTSIPSPSATALGQWSITATTVPEPPTSLLIATGLLGLVCMRRWKRLA